VARIGVVIVGLDVADASVIVLELPLNDKSQDLRRARKTVDAVTPEGVARYRVEGRAAQSPARDKDIGQGGVPLWPALQRQWRRGFRCGHGFRLHGRRGWRHQAASRGAAPGDGADLRRNLSLHRFELGRQPRGDRVELRVRFLELYPERRVEALHLRGESVYAAVQSPNLSAENREAGDQREPGNEDE
jgi:hypothetical protein